LLELEIEVDDLLEVRLQGILEMHVLLEQGLVDVELLLHGLLEVEVLSLVHGLPDRDVLEVSLKDLVIALDLCRDIYIHTTTLMIYSA
jgi:hypothetical protein